MRRESERAMTGIFVFGLLLLVVSGALSAAHWHERKTFLAAPPPESAERDFRFRQLRRRTQASALIGLVGLAMTAADAIPKNEWAITGYLFGLILAALAILWLALSDLLALRFRRVQQDRERLVASLRKYSRDDSSNDRALSDD